MNKTLRRFIVWMSVLFVTSCAAAAPAPTATPPPTSTPATRPSPTATATAAPTATPIPPSETPIPPSATPLPPTATETASPTDTPQPTVDPCRSVGGGPSTRQVKLTVVNKSGSPVIMNLTRCGSETGFLYLTIPEGTDELPTTQVFTIPDGTYAQTTHLCNGLTSSGLVQIMGTMKLTFTACKSNPTAPPGS